MKNKFVKLMSLMIVLLLNFTMFSLCAYAVDVDSKGSITIDLHDLETSEPVSQAKFRLYYVASAKTDGDNLKFEYTNDFKDNGMKLDDLSNEYLPIHLRVYAHNNDASYVESVSDDSGKVLFENLSCGAYLVVPFEIGEGYINPTPFMVTIPMKDGNTSGWIYDVDASPKIEIDRDDVTEKTYISVRKQWKNNSTNPQNVKVALVKDGAVVETAFLNQENNWSYRWDNLDKKHSWSVVEVDVPKGYTVSYRSSQVTVAIVNTANDIFEQTTDSQGGHVDPTPEPTTDPDELIHTGQLNWPVPIFSITGILLFTIGWAILTFGKKEDDAV